MEAKRIIRFVRVGKSHTSSVVSQDWGGKGREENGIQLR